jgi:hypothetical protein
MDRNCTSSSARGRWPEVAAAATAIAAGSGDADEAGGGSCGRGVEGGGAEVELGAELENISWVEEAATELLGGSEDVAAGADVVAGATCGGLEVQMAVAKIKEPYIDEH